MFLDQVLTISVLAEMLWCWLSWKTFARLVNCSHSELIHLLLLQVLNFGLADWFTCGENLNKFQIVFSLLFHQVVSYGSPAISERHFPDEGHANIVPVVDHHISRRIWNGVGILCVDGFIAFKGIRLSLFVDGPHPELVLLSLSQTLHSQGGLIRWCVPASYPSTCPQVLSLHSVACDWTPTIVFRPFPLKFGSLGSHIRDHERSKRWGWTAKNDSICRNFARADGIGQHQPISSHVRPLSFADCDDSVPLIFVYRYPEKKGFSFSFQE